MAFKINQATIDIAAEINAWYNVDFMDAIYYYAYGMISGSSYTDTQKHLRDRKVIADLESTLPQETSTFCCCGLEMKGFVGGKHCTCSTYHQHTEISRCPTPSAEFANRVNIPADVVGSKFHKRRFYDTYFTGRRYLLRFCLYTSATDNCLYQVCVG